MNKKMTERAKMEKINHVADMELVVARQRQPLEKSEGFSISATFIGRRGDMEKQIGKRLQARMEKINKHFGAEVAFAEESSYDGHMMLKVSGEHSIPDILKTGTPHEYYPEFTPYPWISKFLLKLAEYWNCYWEWDNPAVIVLCAK